MDCITVVIENPSQAELDDFCGRLVDGNVAYLGRENLAYKLGVAIDALKEIDTGEALDALEKIY